MRNVRRGGSPAALTGDYLPGWRLRAACTYYLSQDRPPTARFFSPFNLKNKNDSISTRAGCFLDTVTSRTSRPLIWLGVQPSPVLSPHKALNRGRFSMNHRELSNQIDLMPVIKCSHDKAFHLNWGFMHWFSLFIYFFQIFFFFSLTSNRFKTHFAPGFFPHTSSHLM